MGKKIGIWMDKRSAKVISIEKEGAELTSLESRIEDFKPRGGSGTKMKGGPQDVVQDRRYLEREKQQMKAYFQEIVSSLPDLEELVVFGPAETGRKFVDELSTMDKGLYAKVKGVEKADSMTDNQLKAWVIEYYS